MRVIPPASAAPSAAAPASARLHGAHHGPEGDRSSPPAARAGGHRTGHAARDAGREMEHARRPAAAGDHRDAAERRERGMDGAGTETGTEPGRSCPGGGTRTRAMRRGGDEMARRNEMNRMRVHTAAPARSSRAGLVLLLVAASVLSGCYFPPPHGHGYGGGHGHHGGHGRSLHGHGGHDHGYGIGRGYPGGPRHHGH